MLNSCFLTLIANNRNSLPTYPQENALFLPFTLLSPNGKVSSSESSLSVLCKLVTCVTVCHRAGFYLYSNNQIKKLSCLLFLFINLLFVLPPLESKHHVANHYYLSIIIIFPCLTSARYLIKVWK